MPAASENGVHAESLLGQIALQQVAQAQIVVDDQDSCLWARSSAYRNPMGRAAAGQRTAHCPGGAETSCYKRRVRAGREIMKRFVNGGITLGAGCCFAQILVTVNFRPAGEVVRQTTFEESMGWGENPAEDDVSRRRGFPRPAFREQAQRLSPLARRGNAGLYRAAQIRGRYDVMVAPIRSEGYALDRISRSLILKANCPGGLPARKPGGVPRIRRLVRALGEGPAHGSSPARPVIFAAPSVFEKLVMSE